MSVQERVDATERRWRDEVSATKQRLAEAEVLALSLTLEYGELVDAGAPDEDVRVVFRRAMSAYGRMDHLRGVLSRLEQPSELERRLVKSRQLAARFGS